MSDSQQDNEVHTLPPAGEVPGLDPLDAADRVLDGLLTRVFALSSDMIINHHPGIKATETLLNVRRVIDMYTEIERRLITNELTRTIRQLAIRRGEPQSEN